MQHIFGAIPSILKEIDPDGEAVEPIVFAAWERCVDGALGENVVPLRLENNRLIAAVSNEMWRRNIADLGPALTAKLNTAAGSALVKYIEFRVDAAAVLEFRAKSKRPQKDSAARRLAGSRIAAELSTSAAAISDEKLREQFLAAAASSLARDTPDTE